MMDNRQETPSNAEKKARSAPFALMGVVASLIIIILATRQQEGIQVGTPTGQETTRSLSSSSKNKIELGKTKTQAIGYYHCQADKNSKSSTTSSVNTSTSKDLVLLHGASFTKEIWNTTGILDRFCSAATSGGSLTSVTALDLNVMASFDDLLITLKDLQKAGKLHLPISAIVTPSASGHAIIQAIAAGNITKVKSSIQRWIPVACYELLQVKNKDGFSSKDIKSWSILAIYGDRDTTGKKFSEYLQTHSGAAIQELSGGHPVYRDSPREFVKRVLSFMK